MLAFLQVRDALRITFHIVAPFGLPRVDAVDCFEHAFIMAYRPAPIRRYFEVAGGAICNTAMVSERGVCIRRLPKEPGAGERNPHTLPYWASSAISLLV
jgi:hypothetical protein